MLLLTPPTEICGRPVNTHFLFWMRNVGRVLQSPNLLIGEKAYAVVYNVFGSLVANQADEQTQCELLDGIMEFFNCGKEDRGLTPAKEELYHWERDSAAIWADFRIFAHMDLDDENATKDLHWWEFSALFESLPPSSRIKRLIQVRQEDPADYSGKDNEKARKDCIERKRAAAVWPPAGDEEDYEYSLESERRLADGGQ